MKPPKKVQEVIGNTIRKILGLIFDVSMNQKTSKNPLVMQEANKLNKIISQESQELFKKHDIENQIIIKKDSKNIQFKKNRRKV